MKTAVVCNRKNNTNEYTENERATIRLEKTMIENCGREPQ